MEYVNERKGRCVRPVLGSSLWIISFLAAGFLENQTFSNEVFTNAIARVPQRNPRYASFPARPLPRALLRTTLSVTPLRDLSRASPHDPRCAHSLIRPPERENSAREKKIPPFLATPHGGTQLAEQSRAFAAEIPPFYATFRANSLRKSTSWQDRESAASVQPKGGAKKPGFSFSGG